MDSTSTTVWGIDLGTTYSCIARIDETGHPVVVNNREGDQITPSVVMLMDADMVEVGKSAKGQMQLEPDLVCELVKQNMGDPDWRFRAHGKEWSAPEISSFILKALAEDAAMQSGIPVERAVITVPAYFGVAEREATIAAGKMAGLVVEDVINEPTAAAFSYGFAQASDIDETVLVYDLGGGTFDVTVIRLEPTGDGGSRIRVVATGGDDRLGGALWDKRMVKLLADKFQEQLPDAADPLDDDIAGADLRINAEDVKRALTARDSVSQVVMAGVDRASVKVTRAEFEAATDDLLEQTIDFTRTTVAKAAERGAPTIDRVLLVGGSSFMPAVSRRLTEAFPDWNPELQDPNQAVAKGAALAGLQAALRSMIEQATRGEPDGAPPTEEQIKDVAVKAGISVGAATAVLETEVTNVCSRGFGVKLLRDDADPSSSDDSNFHVVHIIEPNTPLPIDGSDPDRVKTFGTVVDNQTEVQICVMEQESRELTGDMAGNRQIEEGLFQMTRAYPRGAPVHIAIGMEGNGTLNIRAIDADGREMQFTATAIGAVVSDEQLAASTSKVLAMQRA
jgi:molecular chaperone DnaK (HSP70)